MPVGRPKAKTTVSGIKTLSMPFLEILSTAVAKNGVRAKTANEVPGNSGNKTKYASRHNPAEVMKKAKEPIKDLVCWPIR